MPKLSGRKTRRALFVCFIVWALAGEAQVFTTLLEFDGNDGSHPFLMTLNQGVDGELYGTTYDGGTANGGTVFRVTSTGILTTLYDFPCSVRSICKNGALPKFGLVLGTDGFWYGAASVGGSSNNSGYGTVFRMSSAGELLVLHRFDATDGGDPNSLVLAADGKLYGTTYGGTFFTIARNGAFTTLHFFGQDDGPNGVIEASDGYFYGTTHQGGANCKKQGGCGTVFRITRTGKLKTLHSFCSQANCTDGAYPNNGLVQASDGNLYGTTTFGGSEGSGIVFAITPAGSIGTLYTFCSLPGCADGQSPGGLLAQATDGNLYGVTGSGGDNACNPPFGCGIVFQLTPDGALTILHSFEFLGSASGGALFQASDGLLYGSTWAGGNPNCNWAYPGCGTIFSLDMGFGPLVRFVRTAAKVGQTFGILGQGLTGASGVSLNGVPTSFTVKSDTLMTASVPSGATTGYVTVTTPSGVLTSNVPFNVIP